MATVNFLLRENKKTNDSTIICVIRFIDKRFTEKKDREQRLVYSTDEKIHPDYWDNDTQRAIEKITGNPTLKKTNETINGQLGRYKPTVSRIEEQQKKLNEPFTKEILKEGIDKEFKKNTEVIPGKKDSITLIPFIQNYKDTVRLTNDRENKQISELTKKKYQTLVNLLTGYIEKRKKKELGFENIDMIFFKDFVDYLQTEKKHSSNTLNKYITTLKMFISLANEDAEKLNITVNQAFRSKFFASPREQVDKIYLAQSELNTLFNLDLSKNKKLDKVRDLFLIGCNTALRYSDYTNIKKGNIYTDAEGIEMLKITTYKTNITVDIPVNYMVKQILAKYNYQLPEQMSNQKMNDYLKELGKLAGFTNEIIITKTIGGKTETKTYFKYQLISTHTARRTGASLMYIAKIPTYSIMMITGHRTEKSFLGYIRVDSAQNASLISKNKFFSTEAPKMGKVVNFEN
jgi:integrase